MTSPAPNLTHPEEYRINFSGSVFDPSSVMYQIKMSRGFRMEEVHLQPESQ
jgi:hypothetical protein